MGTVVRKNRKKWLWIVIAVVVVAGAAGGYYIYSRYSTPQVSSSTSGSTVNTTRVQTGDLEVSATGAGQVIASQEVNLSFEEEGAVIELNVKPGDEVTEGDVLASIDDLAAQQSLASAQVQVEEAQTNLDTAEQAYEDLLAGASESERLAAEANLKSAQATLADLQAGPSAAEVAAAQVAVAEAQEAYDLLVSGDADAIAEKERALAKAKNSLWASQMSRDAAGGSSGKDSTAYKQAQVSVYNAELSVQEAQEALDEAQAPATELELQAAKATLLKAQEDLANLLNSPTEAELASAKAQVAAAQEALDDINAGASETEIAAAEAAVTQAELTLEEAQLALSEAQDALTNTTLTAPFDGTVMSVGIEVGERVEANVTVITVADLSQPLLEVFVDENDMDMVVLGYEAEVSFDSIPGQIFTGTVTQVDPGLISEFSVQVVRCLVQLSPTSYNKPTGLPTGLNATVDIIGGRALNAVLLPVEALREIGTGQYGVFVVENGELVFREVEVGLMDVTYAQILSGLQPGDLVSTGLVETTQ